MTEQPDIPPPSPAGRPTLKLPFELQSDEVVLLFARRHWLFFYGYLAVVILSGIVGTIGLVLLVLSTVGFDGLAGKGIAAALIAWAGYWGVRGYFH